MVEMVISGGQTGADRTALMVAKELGLKTGGWAPKGYRTEIGPDPSLNTLFGLLESTSSSYPLRTGLNVECSDGTVIFGNAKSPGCKLTIACCYNRNKPFKVNPEIGELQEWLVRHNIKILNVAGNRASTNPYIGEIVRHTLRGALR